MKNITAAAICMSILFIGCKKNSDSSSSGGNNGQPPKGGTVTVTAISPQNPHPDNVMTITGTGFSADISKDRVYFGNYDTTKKTFRSYGDGQDSSYESVISSASATQLTFKTKDSLLLDLNIMDAPKYRLVPAIQVIVNNKDTAVYRVGFKEMVRLDGVSDPEQLRQAIPDGWPGDSLLVDCLGPVDNTAVLTIGGKVLAFTTEDIPSNTEHETKLHVFLPKSLATGNNDTLMAPQIVKLALADGTNEQASYQFYLSPVMRITSMGTELASYSHGALGTSGGVININITGRNLKSDAFYSVNQSGITGAFATGYLDVTGYPDQTTIVLPGTTPTGNYNVYVSRKDIRTGTNIFYANCAITIKP